MTQNPIILSKLTERQIEWLTRQLGMSETELIAIAINKLFETRQAHAMVFIARMTNEEIDEEIKRFLANDLAFMSGKQDDFT